MSRRRGVVIGVGNEFRRDDGAGLAVLAEIRMRPDDSVTLVASDGEPTQLIEAWEHAYLAVVVDAVLCTPSTPGRVHRSTLDGRIQPGAATTHGLGIPDAIRLANALDRAPDRLVVFAIEAADLGFGVGLSDDVRRAIPDVTDAVLAEFATL